MRLLITAHAYPPDVSGVAEVARQHAERLATRGHQVHVATRASDRRHRRTEVVQGVEVHRFALSGGGVSGIRGDARDYLTFAHSQSWDFVIMHCAQTWSTDLLLPQLSRMRGRKVVVLHGLSGLNIERYKGYIGWFGVQAAKLDAIVGVTPSYEEEEFCERFALAPPTIIPNGVEMSAWSVPTLSLRSRWRIGDDPWLVNVSNHSRSKGHDTVSATLSAICKTWADARATIIGSPYPAARFRLGSLGIQGGCWYTCVARGAVTRAMSLRPRLPRSQVISAVQEADILLAPSRREASPLAILESMAAGTPWVAFDVGCVASYPGGIVARSSAEMLDATKTLLADREYQRYLGALGKDHVTRHHDWDTIISRYETLFAQLQGAARA